MNKQIYIIGPVTGIDRKEAVAAFAKAASMVKEIGMIPVNPVELVPETATWHEAMRICIPELIECGAYIKLPGWEQSKGSMLELIIAKNMDIPELAIYVGKFNGGGE
ncbi:MAG: DUF4406 domain-containing protein [Flavobacteriales bacterium]|nr:DUF4406 domain-containing protein [Flavobacteriales bacterium]